VKLKVVQYTNGLRQDDRWVGCGVDWEEKWWEKRRIHVA